MTESHTVGICTSITEVTPQGAGPALGHAQHPRARELARAHTRTATHTPPRPPPRARTHVHTHRHACAAGEGRRVSPVRVLLYVIIRGGTIKEAGV